MFQYYPLCKGRCNNICIDKNEKAAVMAAFIGL